MTDSISVKYCDPETCERCNDQPGIRISPDGRGRQWWATNGIAPPIPLCGVCKQFVYEGHVDCSCDISHAERCTRPTYAELKDQHDALVSALETALNTEAAARIGSESGAMQGFDYKYHYDKIRTALGATKR